MYFEAERFNNVDKTGFAEDGADVVSSIYFPRKGSAHPHHPQFKYTGNANVEPLNAQSKIWKADLEYSTSSGSTDVDANGNKITGDTPPWNLLPDSINFSFSEVTMPFENAYNDKNEQTVRVANTAGDKISAMKSHYNMQMSFQFSSRTWDPSYALIFGNTINASAETICGMKFKANSALLLPPECDYVTVYDDGTETIKWQYWNIRINILIDSTGTLFYRKLLNVGDRAKFLGFDISADPVLKAAGISGVISADPTASQICSFRLAVDYNTTPANYYPGGDIVFCSWSQFLQVQTKYNQASKKLMESGKINTWYNSNCEQHTQMPLDSTGYLLTSAIPGFATTPANYQQLAFKQYPSKSWTKMNLPSKGIDNKTTALSYPTVS
jgi:hypothetical protein